MCLVAIVAGTQGQEGFNCALPALRKAEECCRGAELHSASHQWGGLQPGVGSTCRDLSLLELKLWHGF